MDRTGWHSVKRGAMRGLLVAGVAAVISMLFSVHGTVRSTGPVDLALVLALDGSASVDDREFALQRLGLANAFRHPSVLNAILRGRHRRIAVTVVQWAGIGEQQVSVPWTIIDNHRTAAHFAQRLDHMPRRFDGGFTHIAGAIRRANTLTRTAPFAAARRVVDISGDGINTVGNSPHDARDGAVLGGMTINGLTITDEQADLAEYYRLSVIGGPGAFVISANDYDDYARAILIKLLREIDQHFVM